MRTMASVWFVVIVLVSVQKVFGNVCLMNEEKLNCDQCVRCGGEWCLSEEVNVIISFYFL